MIKSNFVKEKSMKNILIAIVVVAIGAFFYFGRSEEASCNFDDGNKEVIYFYGSECPHCVDVLGFIDENKIACKVDFAKKEVWHNKANQTEMMEKVKECGLNSETVGVPFLYAKGECLIGTPKVKEFFKTEAGL